MSVGTGVARVATVRAVEQRAQAALPTGTLMQRAAQAVCEEAQRLLRGLPATTPVLALVGPGNNGADALLTALLLADAGWQVAAIAPDRFDPAAADPDSEGARVRKAWQDRHGPPLPLAALPAQLQWQPLVLDGLFGIGLSRAIGGATADLIASVSLSGLPVLAIDVPSGLDADRGTVVGGPDGHAMRATVTVTLIADKPGLHTGTGRDHAGRVVVAPLGLLAPADADLLDARFARAHAPVRALDSHKGSYGSVLIIGGAATMQGAALLAAGGAQACGAGKVFVMSPAGPLFDPGQPQWMTRAWDAPLADVDALVLGCGLGTGDVARAACARAIDAPVPAIIDADALTVVAQDPVLRARLAARPGATALTPHPLEAARLLGGSTREVQADRAAATTTLARQLNAVVLLKGAGSIVADPDGRWAIIDSGAPTLATAGSGDVLSGMIGALLAQGMPAPLAVRLAGWHHGHAGELARAALPRAVGLAAGELPALVRQSLNGMAALAPACHHVSGGRPC